MIHEIPDELIVECRRALQAGQPWHTPVCGRQLVLVPWAVVIGIPTSKLMVAYENGGCAIVSLHEGFSALNLIRGGLGISLAQTVINLLEQIGFNTPQPLLTTKSFPKTAAPRRVLAKMRASASQSQSRTTKTRHTTSVLTAAA